MARRGKRGLSEDDLLIWSQVAKTADPLRKQMPLPATKKKPRAEPQARPPVSSHPKFELPRHLPGTLKGPPVTLDLARDPMQANAGYSGLMDKRHFERLRRGKLDPEARLDLHGMNAEQAHAALNGFILRSFSQNLRLVLVITGKGKPPKDSGIMPGKQGVLRHSLPNWLSAPRLAPLILEFGPAHQRHGGGGAYYIYLRRQR